MTQEQHKCPGCGAEALGYVGAVPLGRCTACGKSFEPRDFLPKDEPEPMLEELLDVVEGSLDLDNCKPFALDKQVFLLLSALVRKVSKLEQENESMRDSLGSHARNIKRLKGIP
jgi:hypothetical protein